MALVVTSATRPYYRAFANLGSSHPSQMMERLQMTDKPLARWPQFMGFMFFVAFVVLNYRAESWLSGSTWLIGRGTTAEWINMTILTFFGVTGVVSLFSNSALACVWAYLLIPTWLLASTAFRSIADW